MVTRDDLRRLAEVRLLEAKVLLDGGHFSGAYYLAGYSVELALKACIARSFQADTIPAKAFVQNIHTHELTKLVGLAGLRSAFDKAIEDTSFAARWGVVSNWDESSRYEARDCVAAHALVQCCEEVLEWIRPHW